MCTYSQNSQLIPESGPMLLMVPLKPDGIFWQTPEEKWRLVHDPVKLISVQAYTVPARLSCSQEMLSGRV